MKKVLVIILASASVSLFAMDVPQQEANLSTMPKERENLAWQIQIREALRRNDLETASTLIEENKRLVPGATVIETIKSNNLGTSLAELSTRSDRYRVLKFLINKKLISPDEALRIIIQPDAPFNEPVNNKLLSHFKELLTDLIKLGANINIQDNNGDTLLFVLVRKLNPYSGTSAAQYRKNTLVAIQILLNAGAKPDLQNTVRAGNRIIQSESPIFYLLRLWLSSPYDESANDLEAGIALLLKYANPCATDDKGRTLLDVFNADERSTTPSNSSSEQVRNTFPKMRKLIEDATKRCCSQKQ
jgi:hypothetical protein